MLTKLTTGLRFRLAIVLAALAALCFVMPPAAVAFCHGENTAPCPGHAHMVGQCAAKTARGQNHAGHSTPAGSHQMTCCGLFCLSALPAETGAVIGKISNGPDLETAPKRHLLSRSPEHPYRPPISHLFV